MDELPDIDRIHEVLLQTIEDDPDHQVKALIASHLGQRNSPPLIYKLFALSKSHHPDVREIIAINLENQFIVFDEILDWFELEEDLVTLEKLFITLTSILRKCPKDINSTAAAIRLHKFIKQEINLQYSLELIGYCDANITVKMLLEASYKYRFDNKIKASILRGMFHLAQMTSSLPDDIQSYLISFVGTSYEPVELRKIGLEALGEIKNQKVIDLFELIIETDRNPILREKAIALVGKWGVIELSPLLIEKLKYDGRSDVRASAAIALGAMSSFDAITDLSDALESDISFFVREASAEALGTLKSQHAIFALLKGLEDHDSYVRATSAWSIEQLQPNTELIMRICKTAKSLEQEISVRNGMVSLLARMGSLPEAADCLLTIFREDKTPLRELVLEALEEFVPNLQDNSEFLDSHLPFILETLATSESFSLRAAICTFLGHLKDDSTFSFLFNSLINDDDAFVKRQAAWAISNLNSEDHGTKIHSSLLEKSYHKIVPLFLEILTAWAEVSDIPLVISFLKPEIDVDWRQRAVEFLTAIITSPDLNKRYTDTIIDSLTFLLHEDRANTVRSASAHALGHFEGFDSLITPALIRAIKEDRIYTVRELAAEALGYRGGLSAVSELFNLVHHKIEKDPSIRYFSSLALLNIEAQITKT